MTYEESSAINFSKLSALLEGVEYFKKVTTEDIFSEPYLSFGTAVHHFFLENETFNDNYLIFRNNKPSNAKHKEFCVLLAQQDKINAKTRVDCYKSIFATERKKEAVIENNSTKLYVQFKDYIDFLIQAKNKTILSEADYLRIKTFEGKFNKHKGIRKLLYDNKDIELTFNELPIFFKYRDHNCKAKLDRLAIDTVNKIVYVIDLKTHATKSLKVNIRKTFHASVFKYNYHMQQAMYYLAACDFMKKKLGLNPDEYTFKPIFILMHSNFTNGVKLFQLNQDELYEGLMDINGALELFNFHKEHGFDFDIDYYDNELGFEKLMK